MSKLINTSKDLIYTTLKTLTTIPNASNYKLIYVVKAVKQSDGNYRYYYPDLVPICALTQGPTYLNVNPINIWIIDNVVYAMANDTSDNSNYLFIGIK